MPSSLNRESVFTCVSEESLGFQFGKPDRPNENSLACILPILRETSQKRQYITLPEAGDKVVLTDSGSINKVMLKNSSEENVFVRAGSIFGGKGTQSRALTRSAVLFPKQDVGLDVRCIHASHGIRSGSSFEYDGITPLNVDSAFYQDGYRPSDQSTMWNLVKEETITMRPRRASASMHSYHFSSQPYAPLGGSLEPDSAFAGDDDLRSNFDAFAKNFDSILSKARLHDHQVGLALITDRGVSTVELFDVDASWESMHKDAVKRMGTELLRGADNTSVFEYKPENAINAVKAVLALPFTHTTIYEHKPSNGEPYVAVTGLTAKGWVGEIVEIDLRVIHMTLLRKA